MAPPLPFLVDADPTADAAAAAAFPATTAAAVASSTGTAISDPPISLAAVAKGSPGSGGLKEHLMQLRECLQEIHTTHSLQHHYVLRTTYYYYYYYDYDH